MSGIFKKITTGVTQTGSKVKNIVEVNRFRVRIVQKKRDVEKEYMEIGKLVFESYQNNNATVTIEGSILDYCQKISEMQGEVNLLEAKINDAKRLKECSCGEVVSKKTKFCPICGYKFKDAV